MAESSVSPPRLKAWFTRRAPELRLTVRITVAGVVAALRSAQMTRDLPIEMIGRIFALGFALEQLRTNLADFANRVAERARET